MGRSNRHGALSKKKMTRDSAGFPKIFLDRDADFASIKIKPGVEAKSYLKDGVVVCEDSKGNVIEIQILNVSDFKQKVTA